VATYGKFQVTRNKVKNPNMFDKVKNKKKSLPELSKSEKFSEGVEIWAGFYRCNLHRFVKEYFDINLKLFQKILLFMMGYCVNFIYLASRRQGNELYQLSATTISGVRPRFFADDSISLKCAFFVLPFSGGVQIR